MPPVGGKPRGPVAQLTTKNSNPNDSNELFTRIVFSAVLGVKIA